MTDDGPIDFLILEIPAGAAATGSAQALGDLVERNVAGAGRRRSSSGWLGPVAPRRCPPG
jgi:hypothetical protein